jgi:hypothetical protein
LLVRAALLFILSFTIPVFGCNDDLANYGARPVGDLPETMPLDESLNNDAKTTLRRHVVATKDLDEEDERKFSLSTPKRCSKAFRRLWDFGLTGKEGEDQHKGGVPCGRRIIQDCQQVLVNLHKIDEQHGGFIPGLGGRNGRRATVARAAGGVAQRGGHRVKMTAEAQKEKLERWEHPLLEGRKVTAVQRSLNRHDGVRDGDGDDEEI